MATSDAASSAEAWGRALQPPPSLARAVFSPSSDSIVVTAATSNLTAARRAGEGRVARPARRRPRASRKVPVTVFNTDTANFRAMVQQFTGFPSGPYSSSYRPAGGGTSILNFGPGFGDPAGHIRQHRYQEQHFQPQQQQLQQQQRQYDQYPDAIFGLNSSGVGGGRSDGFLQGLNSSATTSVAMADGGFLFDAMSSQTVIRPTSVNHRVDGYF